MATSVTISRREVHASKCRPESGPVICLAFGLGSASEKPPTVKALVAGEYITLRHPRSSHLA
jgi:hypothetical protein